MKLKEEGKRERCRFYIMNNLKLQIDRLFRAVDDIKHVKTSSLLVSILIILQEFPGTINNPQTFLHKRLQPFLTSINCQPTLCRFIRMHEEVMFVSIIHPFFFQTTNNYDFLQSDQTSLMITFLNWFSFLIKYKINILYQSFPCMIHKPKILKEKNEKRKIVTN